MARRSALRSQLYRSARDLGTIEAAERGPGSYARRVVRRKVYRTTNGMTRHLLRSLGL
jgi:stalled ribosome alternative rescue factor ArfA